ncbi:hypothetical protein D3C84_809320 [compost metagenome]
MARPVGRRACCLFRTDILFNQVIHVRLIDLLRIPRLHPPTQAGRRELERQDPEEKDRRQPQPVTGATSGGGQPLAAVGATQ